MMIVARRLGGLTGWCAGWVATLAPVILPGRVLVASDLVALRHPRPSSPGHLLILPRTRTPGLDGPPDAVALAVCAMVRVARTLATATSDRPDDVVAVINGGIRQDVRLLHMHLVTNAGLANALRDAEARRGPCVHGQSTTARPLQPVHVLFNNVHGEVSGPLLADIQQTVASHHLAPGGYSLMARAMDPSLLHLVGERPLHCAS